MSSNSPIDKNFSAEIPSSLMIPEYYGFNWEETLQDSIKESRMKIYNNLKECFKSAYGPFFVEHPVYIIGSFVYGMEFSDIDILIDDIEIAGQVETLFRSKDTSNEIKLHFIVYNDKKLITNLNYFHRFNYYLGLCNDLTVMFFPQKYFYKNQMIIKNILPDDKYLVNDKNFDPGKRKVDGIKLKMEDKMWLLRAERYLDEEILDDEIREALIENDALIAGGCLRDIVLEREDNIKDVDIICHNRDFLKLCNDIMECSGSHRKIFEAKKEGCYETCKILKNGYVFNITGYEKGPLQVIDSYDYTINMLFYDPGFDNDHKVRELIDNVCVNDIRLKKLTVNEDMDIFSFYRVVNRLGRFINEGFKIDGENIFKLKTIIDKKADSNEELKKEINYALNVTRIIYT